MTELIVISCFACGRMYFSQYLEQLKFFNKPIQVLKKKKRLHEKQFKRCSY